MLKTLHIENIAVIEKSEIDFSLGFHALTGETGAGKSIIIDSINMVMGERTSKDIIRSGAKSAFVSAIFENLSLDVTNLILEAGFEFEDDGSLLIQREIFENGRNLCKVNGRPAPMSFIKDLSRHIVNIHGQHDNQALLWPEEHIHFLDSFIGQEELLGEYSACYGEYQRLLKALRESKTDETKRLQDIDLLGFQVSEIEDAALSKEEEAELLSRRKILQHLEKITSAVSLSHAIFFEGREGEPSVSDLLGQIEDNISTAVRLNPSFEEDGARFFDALEELRSSLSSISRNVEEIDGSSMNLSEIEERLELISKLKRKYGADIDAIFEFYEEAKARLQTLIDYDFNRMELEAEFKRSQKKLLNLALHISRERKEKALLLEEKLKEEFSFLDMPNMRFKVKIQAPETSDEFEDFNQLGIDEVEFLIAANKGEDFKPLHKTASGGELSRIMLALKNILPDGDKVDTLIFDEIDSGISGRAADKVAKKLYDLSRTKQVFCVTHLTQMAAFADYHYLIEKNVEKEHTFTHVKCLDLEGKIKELARIIGGDNVTKLQLENAEEMLSLANEYKSKRRKTV